MTRSHVFSVSPTAAQNSNVHPLDLCSWDALPEFLRQQFLHSTCPSIPLDLLQFSSSTYNITQIFYIFNCLLLSLLICKPKIQDFGLSYCFSPSVRYLTHYRNSINSVLIRIHSAIFINSSLGTIKYSKSEESKELRKQNPCSHGTQYSPEGSNKKKKTKILYNFTVRDNRFSLASAVESNFILTWDSQIFCRRKLNLVRAKLCFTKAQYINGFYFLQYYSQ